MRYQWMSVSLLLAALAATAAMQPSPAWADKCWLPKDRVDLPSCAEHGFVDHRDDDPCIDFKDGVEVPCQKLYVWNDCTEAITVKINWGGGRDDDMKEVAASDDWTVADSLRQKDVDQFNSAHCCPRYGTCTF